jgi:mannose-6-phosphate isomerase
MLMPLYPLRFREVLRDYGFGARWIVEAYEKTGLPEAPHRVGETWEICDRPNGESSVALNGPLAGQTLHALIDLYGESLLGTDIVARCGTRFPLLIKFLDATRPLGEQAHHSDELAAERGLVDPGKTEAWYMLAVRPRATIRVGNKGGVTRESVREALLAGTIKELMHEYAVSPGDAFLLYAGTMHYSAGGVLFYEIMQNSDVYIGLRAPDPSLSPGEREAVVGDRTAGLHLEEGFDAKTVPVVLGTGVNTRTFIFACRHFALERLDLMAPTMVSCNGDRFYVLTLIEGACTVVCGEQHEVLRPGHSLLLPASLGRVAIVPTEPSALLKAYLPDLVNDVVRPLRLSGIPDAAILGLGGSTELNDLAPLLGDEIADL